MAKSKKITVEDLWKCVRPSSPTFSPDASQLCVARTSYDMEANKASTALWLLSTFGGEPRALTQCGEKDGQPLWSPDGSLIAFVAKRGTGKDADEEPQLYVIPPDGGEARRVTKLATGVSAIKWFPNGKRLAFVSWVWPDLKGEKAQAARVKERADSKVKAHVVEHTVYKFWDHWLTDGRVPHLHVVDLDSGKVQDLFVGTPYRLPSFDPSAADYDVAPDGKHIAFHMFEALDPRWDHPSDVFELEIKTRHAKNLTKRAGWSHANPAYSPDGTKIAVLGHHQARSVDDDAKLFVLDRTKSKNNLRQVSQWDRNLTPPLKWAADSSAVFYLADDRSRTSVYRHSLAEAAPTVVAQGGTVTEFALAGEAVCFVRNDMSHPPQTFTCHQNGDALRPVENWNEAPMAGLKLGEVREFTIKGWNGEPVQMWAVYPPDFDAKKKWPLLHSIHGGPHANWGDNFHFRWNNHVFAAQGYVVVCVNYHGSLGWGNAFLESNIGSFGTKEHADVEAGTDFMLKRGYIDANRLVASGGSYGGKMVAWMNGRNGAKKGGDRYKAYVCHAGCYDWEAMYAGDAGYWFGHQLKTTPWDNPTLFAEQNPSSYAKHMKTPTLVIHGALDYRVPDAQGFAYYSTLKALNVPTRLVFFPDENHWILRPQNSKLWYNEYFAWLARFVGKRAPGGASKSKRTSSS